LTGFFNGCALSLQTPVRDFCGNLPDQRSELGRGVAYLFRYRIARQEKQIVAGDPSDWARESFAITLDENVHYCVQEGDNCQYSDTQLLYVEDTSPRIQVIDAAYLQRFERLAQELLRLAGFRLAHLINQALDPN